MTGEKTAPRQFRVGFQTSIITVFAGVVLLVGLTLVYLSFERVTSITRTAASGFIEKLAQLGADHVDEQFFPARRLAALRRAVRPACQRRRRRQCQLQRPTSFLRQEASRPSSFRMSKKLDGVWPEAA